MSEIIKEHGISVGLHRLNGEFYMKIVIKGQLTHEDYKVLTPMLENAITHLKELELKVFIDARNFTGWDLHAAWDDLKLGLKHSKEFQKIAYVGSKPWEEYMIKVSNWFTSGQIKFFEDTQEALTWLEV